jgi:hypothetical protein
MDKPKTVTSRMVVQHTHKVSDGKPKETDPVRQDVRIGRAKRLLEEAEQWEAKAASAIDRLKEHPLATSIAEAKLETDKLEQGWEAKRVEAVNNREAAVVANAEASKKENEADRLKKAARQFRERAQDFEKQAHKLDDTIKAESGASRENGLHRKLKTLEKQFNTATHKIAKQGREARSKAARIRVRLNCLLKEIAPLLQDEGEEKQVTKS